MSKSLTDSESAEASSSAGWQEVVQRTVAGIRFGSVQVTVHEGRVTQVEAVEKTRFATGDAFTGAASRFRPRS